MPEEELNMEEYFSDFKESFEGLKKNGCIPIPEWVDSPEKFIKWLNREQE